MTKNNKDESMDSSRVIVHIDLDAFYCQVEHLRLAIPLEEPLAVQQWQGLIAVNYAARALGIQRHSNVKEALELCPTLHLVHVATTTNEDITPTYREYKDISYQTHKISLDFYRKASAQIMKLLSNFCIQFQRASIDEAYLDLTSLVDEELDSQEQNSPSQVHLDWSQYNTSVIQASDLSYDITTIRLYEAAKITCKIRKALKDELGYTCSAGISVNKTVSKLVSSRYKPNQQTVLHPNQILDYLKPIQLSKLRGLGGKLGDEIESVFRVHTIQESLDIPLESFLEQFGTETGSWVYHLCRGICHEPVVQVNLVKSFAACKSFRPYLKSQEQIIPWIDILSTELYTRILEEYDANKRWGKTLTLSWNMGGLVKSKSTALMARASLDSPSLISKLALDVIKNENVSCMNLSRISLTVTGLDKEPENQGLVSQWLCKRMDASLDEQYHCKKCGKFLLIRQKQEHEDFHYALEISKSVEVERPQKQLKLTRYFSK